MVQIIGYYRNSVVNSLETWGAAGVVPGKEELRRKFLGRAEGKGALRNLSNLGKECVGRTKVRLRSSSGDPHSNLFGSSVDPLLHFRCSWLSLLLKVYFMAETTLSSFLALYTCVST